MKLLLLRTDHVYFFLSRSFLNSMFAEPIRQELLHLSLGRVLCERMLGTRRFWAEPVGAGQWSWRTEWKARLAWIPGKQRLGLRPAPWQQPDLWRSKTGPESENNQEEKQLYRKQLLKRKINWGNRRPQTKMGSHQNGKGSETKKEMRYSTSS